jgi:hypothetical protein
LRDIIEVLGCPGVEFSDGRDPCETARARESSNLSGISFWTLVKFSVEVEVSELARREADLVETEQMVVRAIDAACLGVVQHVLVPASSS